MPTTTEEATTSSSTTGPTTTAGPTTTCQYATTTSDQTPPFLSGVPVEPESHGSVGCEDPAKERVVIYTAGSTAPIKWPILDSSGNRIQPETCTPNTENAACGNTRAALFYDPFDSCFGVQRGTIMYTDGEDLQIGVPSKVKSRPGIYYFELHWTNEDGSQYISKGLVSVEASLLQRLGDQNFKAPLSLTEIRTRLRDFPGANELTGSYDYSPEEILEAIMRPIAYWNETSPVISRFSTSNFPFRSNWLDATVSTLYTTGAHWMLRNSLDVKGEGIGASDRDKWKVMFEYSAKGWAQYQAFVFREKARENASGAFIIM